LRVLPSPPRSAAGSSVSLATQNDAAFPAGIETAPRRSWGPSRPLRTTTALDPATRPAT
jgi:hypothetical protein